MSARALRILMVEDDPAHAEITRRYLEQLGVEEGLVHVTDGQAALDYLLPDASSADGEARLRPDLILLDLRLPRVDGLEVLSRVKQSPEVCRIPVVVMTTSDAIRDVDTAYKQGAASYLIKPADHDRFSRLLQAFHGYWFDWNRFADA